MQRKVPRSVGACYDMIETHMRRGPWVMRDAYTIADPYLFALASGWKTTALILDASHLSWRTGRACFRGQT
jgi:glutathione S-transferase